MIPREITLETIKRNSVQHHKGFAEDIPKENAKGKKSQDGLRILRIWRFPKKFSNGVKKKKAELQC